MVLSQIPEPWLIDALPPDGADRLVRSQCTALRRIRSQETEIRATMADLVAATVTRRRA